MKRGNVNVDGTYENWCSIRKPKLKASDIIGNSENFDENHLFYGANVAVTGTLTKWTGREALQKIADIGGIVSASVTKTTDFLVVGQQDFRVVGESGMSSKQKRAIEIKDKGGDIEIISEKDFVEMFI